jgi:hypothetical protein
MEESLLRDWIEDKEMEGRSPDNRSALLFSPIDGGVLNIGNGVAYAGRLEEVH